MNPVTAVVVGVVATVVTLASIVITTIEQDGCLAGDSQVRRLLDSRRGQHRHPCPHVAEHVPDVARSQRAGGEGLGVELEVVSRRTPPPRHTSPPPTLFSHGNAPRASTGLRPRRPRSGARPRVLLLRPRARRFPPAWSAQRRPATLPGSPTSGAPIEQRRLDSYRVTLAHRDGAPGEPVRPSAHRCSELVLPGEPVAPFSGTGTKM